MRLNRTEVEPIIEETDKSALEDELKRQTCLAELSRGSMQLYVVDGHRAPAVMREIGRRREIAFRASGGGTGLACDVDRFDLDPELGFSQLICWDSDEGQIMGGYRILYGKDCRLDACGQPDMPSSHLFRFSDRFIRDYFPYTMELSRSFVSELKNGGSDAARRNIFTLDMLFGGLALLSNRNGIRHVFGKVTFYPSYPAEAFGLLMAFFDKHCADAERLAVPYKPYNVPIPDYAAGVLGGDSYYADFRALTKELHCRGFYMPPILKSYLKIFGGARVFGSAINDLFGNVVEMGMLCRVKDLVSDRYASIALG